MDLRRFPRSWVKPPLARVAPCAVPGVGQPFRPQPPSHWGQLTSHSITGHPRGTPQWKKVPVVFFDGTVHLDSGLPTRRPRVAHHRSARLSLLIFLASRFSLSVDAASFFEDLVPPLSLPAIRWPPDWALGEDERVVPCWHATPRTNEGARRYSCTRRGLRAAVSSSKAASKRSAHLSTARANGAPGIQPARLPIRTAET